MQKLSFKNFILTGAVLCAVGLVGVSAVACVDGPEGTDSTRAFGDHGSHGIYADVMKTMHRAMDAVMPTGDADVDFVNGMIPHHQGAIDMAKILKEKGTDPALQKMASDIIKAQEAEIAVMKKWLAAHPVPAASTVPSDAHKMDEMKK